MAQDAMGFMVEVAITTFSFCKAVLVAMVRTVVPPAEKSVRGEVVLVTGAGSGIGRLMAVQFARRGAVVVSWDVDDEGNKETSRLVKEAGAVCHVYNVDVSNKDLVEEYAKRVQVEVGDVSILVNNAGVVLGKKILECPDEMIRKTFDVNLLAHFWTVKQFLPRIMAQGKGHLVFISSMLGVNAFGGVADYGGSKAGVLRLAKSLREELLFSPTAGEVHVTSVCPYHIDTGLFAGCRTTKALLPGMVARDHGHIVTVASLAGLFGTNKLGDYSASKFGTVGLTEALDSEMVTSGHRVHVTTICPFFINTGLFYGCTNRFPWLLPTLDPQKTVERIMQAILTNQKVLYVPRTMYFLAVLKTILPVDAFLILHKFLGATNFMDTFIGRKKED